ncbi:MAG: NfeD family protein [Prevotella sp.]|nr:NfeD family protein [Prevotella sp.]
MLEELYYYMDENMWQVWLLVAFVTLILEIFTTSFFIACFTLGALCAMISTLFGNVYTQITVFTIASAVSIFLIRPIIMHYMKIDESWRPSNIDALIGRTGIVSEEIEKYGFGRVQVDGDYWKAESYNGEAIHVGEKVEVIEIDSIIIKVRKICS